MTAVSAAIDISCTTGLVYAVLTTMKPVAREMLAVVSPPFKSRNPFFPSLNSAKLAVKVIDHILQCYRKDCSGCVCE